MEVITPTKTAICREKINPKDSVTQKVMASDLVERDNVDLASLNQEKPIKSTRVAREASGINSVFPKEKAYENEQPVYILEFREMHRLYVKR